MLLKLNTVICCTLIFFLTACNSEEDTATESGKTSSQPKKNIHPWDWEPKDPELITGKAIYLQECSLCHNEGEEGAPALTHLDEWQNRSNKGENVLIDHAIHGFVGEDGKMPARGGTETLTDEEVTAAVKFMTNTPK